MSEAGWRAFISADDLSDWVVLHGGPVAAFSVSSLTEATALAAVIAEVPGLTGANVALTATPRFLTVRLTRELWAIEEEHLDLARAISAVARDNKAIADRGAVQEVQFAVSAKPDQIDVAFWRAVLGYREVAPDNGLDPLGHSSTVWMQELDPDKALRHAMHIDVSVAREEGEARLAAALAAGGVLIDDSAAPAAWTLADKSGNKVDIACWPDGARYPDSGDSGDQE